MTEFFCHNVERASRPVLIIEDLEKLMGLEVPLDNVALDPLFGWGVTLMLDLKFNVGN